MNLVDIIQIFNMNSGNDIDDMEKFYADIDIDERIDKSTLIGVLLDECGAMDVLYSTTGTFKYFSDNFFKKYKWNIGKLLDTLDLEYDPIKNKNISWTETTSIEQNLDTAEESGENRNKKNTGTQTSKDTGTQKNEYEENEENTISAMNSGSYQPDNKSEKDGNNTRTDDLTNTRTDDLNEAITSSKDRNKNEALTWEETDSHVESGTNDIIVQDLIEKERRVAQFSVYGWIAKKYAHELFLLVY